MSVNALPAVPEADALPPYSRNDTNVIVETASIHSTAPSYRSYDAPSYTTIDPADRRQAASATSRTTRAPRVGLPPTSDFAPGFRSRASSRAMTPSEMYNSGMYVEWSSLHSDNLQARHYQNVARRRVREGNSNSSGTDNVITGLAQVVAAISSPSPFPISTTSSSSYASAASSSSSPSSSSTAAAPQTNAASEEPLNPHEDPDLVGEAAATRARQQRLYMQEWREQEMQAMMQEEGRNWDFLLNQMADWDERQSQWKAYQNQVERRGLVGWGLRRGKKRGRSLFSRRE